MNHPKLIYDVLRAQQSAAGSGRRNDEGAAGFEDCEKFFPESFHRERSACAEMSGKFSVAAQMLDLLRRKTKDRIVIVSCYTQTLDLFGEWLGRNAVSLYARYHDRDPCGALPVYRLLPLT